MNALRPSRSRKTLLLILASAAMIFSPMAGRAAAQAPAAAQTVTPTPAQASTKPTKLTPKEAREAEINAESDKLFQLAMELKVEVEKSNKDTMSLAVIKKAAEVEKLANALRLHLLVN